MEGDVVYNNLTYPIAVKYFSGKAELSTANRIIGETGKSTLVNGISIDGKGLDGFIRLTCGVTGFAIRDSNGSFVLKDTLSDKTVRKGAYTFEGDCKRNGSFKLHFPNGTMKKVSKRPKKQCVRKLL